MAGQLISSSIFTGAEELIRSAGRHPAQIARHAGVPTQALQDSDLLVSAPAAIQFFELAASACHNPNWGLELSVDARLAPIIGPLWILLRNARTVREMCMELANNWDLYSNVAIIGFEEGPEGGGLLCWSAAANIVDNTVQMAQFALAVFCKELRTHCRPGWHPQAVLFRHRAPKDIRLHRKLFGSAPLFDQDHDALLLDQATLAQPLRSQTTPARSTIRSMLRRDSESAYADTALRVESIIRSLMPYGPCNLRDVSLAMGLAPRTLQAHLKTERTSFHQVRDRVRADLALKYVQHSRLSAGQIAEILGYTDATSFSRSFRRWHQRGVRDLRRTLAREVCLVGERGKPYCLPACRMTEFSQVFPDLG